MLPFGRSYDEIVSAFRWRIPATYNIAEPRRTCSPHATTATAGYNIAESAGPNPTRMTQVTTAQHGTGDTSVV